ncbi:hypothetical protein B0H63DRAFT_304330 [Podospora didyma]|uniref:Zn(2)-C6 fungal-type domain-containing protein n=1 Tax=Podospora didyma TaxID=330526 RepID=A0AAE0N3Z1_9PEZI|nr:hypothetical protein B0H63DRAFT_304330 [Podospora didyma]
MSSTARGEQSPTPGVSSRRSACDRCRGQKLRCLREGADPDGRCDRCAKADAQCVTSPIYHMRNYSIQQDDAPITASSSHKRRRQDTYRGRDIDQQPQQSQQRQQLPSQAPSTVGPAVSPNTFEWPQSVDPFGRSPNNVEPSSTGFSPPSWSTLVDSMVAQPSASAPPPVAVHSWDAGDLNELEQILAADGAARPFASFDKSNKPTRGDDNSNNTPSSSGPPLQQPTADPQTGGPWMGYRDDVLADSSLGAFSSLGLGMLKDSGPPASSESTRHTEVLSRLNLDLVKQLKRMAKGPPSITMKTIIAADCTSPSDLGEITTPLEDILSSTRQFLDVLGHIAGSPSVPTPAVTNAGSSMPQYQKPTVSSASTSSASQDDSSLSSSSASSPGPSPQPSNSSTASGPKNYPDMSTLLLVLICYVHVLRLHVALFAHIRDYLQILAESENRTLPTLPGGLPGFDNFPVESGNLQATMIIHYVANTLDKIETLLGLPRELRIGTREDSSHGLLRNERFLEVAESVIRKEDVGREVEGKGGIRSLRRNMKKSKRLLRSRINP